MASTLEPAPKQLVVLDLGEIVYGEGSIYDGVLNDEFLVQVKHLEVQYAQRVNQLRELWDSVSDRTGRAALDRAARMVAGAVGVLLDRIEKAVQTKISFARPLKIPWSAAAATTHTQQQGKRRR
ncbi:uncharacterized protein AMSG_04931 [Thecamonas trahens ATCC 50062]|uniref:Uncharacterized protein n=1 Tax=Thecamonas trahens ATCC 50062 TaxID=461836 RepID=A0A0L0D808_THETB|nr:hypothetical protein AMSG_04931 [Thecamonas trahens ATCC 50062]KNC48484.1 hypothetical protein AMSG_04931 [Thecamonas trahens ATCC 50062]|eukprot:XP_013758595.1 hypothetical protein AMSG_04931 [Thecamonas trahens ATCC 50062]